MIPYGDYSGNPDLSSSWTSLHWPPENWLPPWLIAATANDLLYTGVEHTFGNHVTSMFLYTFVEGWYPALGTSKQGFHYETPQEKVDLINTFGGLAIDAHPVDTPLDGVVAQEVYNAHFRVGALSGARSTDFNETYFLPI